MNVHCSGVGDFQKVLALGLDLDKPPERHRGALDLEDLPILDLKLVHHLGKGQTQHTKPQENKNREKWIER